MGDAFRPAGLPAPPNPKGSVLIAVLALIALLSFIMIAFMEEAMEKIRYYGLFYNRDDLRIEAYSALETSLAVINEIREIDRGLYSPVQGWGDPLRYAQVPFDPSVDIRIKVVDESGKIPLATATPLLLNILFEEMGVDFTVAQVLTDSLLDWTDTDDLTRLNGAETDHYKGQRVTYRPPDGKVQSWDEIALIRGFDTEFFDEEGSPNGLFFQFKDAMSLNHEGAVNLNSASEFVLRVVARSEGFDSTILHSYLNGTDAERGTEDDRLINSRDNANFPIGIDGRSRITDLRSQIFKISVEVSRGDASFLLTSIVSWRGSNPGAAASTANTSEARNRVRSGVAERGSTAVRIDAGEALGYPYEILRLTENFKI